MNKIRELRQTFETAREKAALAWSKLQAAMAYSEAVEVQYRQAKAEQTVAQQEYDEAKREREAALDVLIDAETALADTGAVYE